MKNETLTPLTPLNNDGQVILLLCSTLALPRSSGGVKPLSGREWNELARGISTSHFRRPGALLGAAADDIRRELRLDASLAERIGKLLERGGQVAIERSRLEDLGIWVLTRVDANYPPRLKERLRGQAPPVLFGAGPQPAMNDTGLAVVGSRDVDDAGAAFAALLGERCAAEGLVVFSGGARGVDQLAVKGCLDHGGAGVAVLADSLEQTLKRREVGRSVLESRLTLITPLHPSTRFTVAGAMGRNKLIYALASWAAVVSAGLDSGGTWAGAIENLRAGWVPLFVRAGESVPPGNRELINRGGIPLGTADVTEGLRTWIEQHDIARSRRSDLALIREDSPTYRAPSRRAESTEAADVFPMVWPSIAAYLSTPRSETEVATAFSLEPSQVNAWLTRAVREGLAERTTDPVKYSIPAASRQDQEPTLFD
ncbi:MAG TPA: DNA-processing protein DprA [Vicinamibacterales bacterium]|nr:DNA-processing protein DprA [Vicinamibacterales bacterium]